MGQIETPIYAPRQRVRGVNAMTGSIDCTSSDVYPTALWSVDVAELSWAPIVVFVCQSSILSLRDSRRSACLPCVHIFSHEPANLLGTSD